MLLPFGSGTHTSQSQMVGESCMLAFPLLQHLSWLCVPVFRRHDGFSMYEMSKGSVLLLHWLAPEVSDTAGEGTDSTSGDRASKGSPSHAKYHLEEKQM